MFLSSCSKAIAWLDWFVFDGTLIACPCCQQKFSLGLWTKNKKRCYSCRYSYTLFKKEIVEFSFYDKKNRCVHVLFLDKEKINLISVHDRPLLPSKLTVKNLPYVVKEKHIPLIMNKIHTILHFI